MLRFKNTVARAVTGVTFTPDGRFIAGGSGGFDVWQLDGVRKWYLEQPAVRRMLAFHADPWGRWFYHSTARSGLQLFALDTFRPSRLPGHEWQHDVGSLAVAESAKKVAVSRGWNGINRIECWSVNPVTGEWTADWAVRDGYPCSPYEPFYLRQQPYPDTYTWCLDFDPPGVRLYANILHPRLVVGGSLGMLTVLNATTGEVLDELSGCRAGEGVEHTVLTDGRVVVWSSVCIELWDSTTRGRIAANAGHGRAHVTALAVHPSGRFVASVGGDGKVRLWSAADLSPLRTFDWGIGKLHAVAFNQNGTLAAAGGDKGKVVVWDVDD